MEELKQLILDIQRKLHEADKESELHVEQLTDSINKLISRVNKIEAQYSAIESQLQLLQKIMIQEDIIFKVKAHEDTSTLSDFSDNFDDVKETVTESSWNDDDEFKIVN